ncbi:flagellar hook-basal body complex protein [Petrotoga sp. HWHPT.55.6.3]|uniref:flagellar hook-basal body complex protein n=1 Tax=Petrotoga sp. HWHPT.55.6.3 TaxID=1434330 RepID=UPI000CA02590|nr:flagellar hook-basal body complex protein [Petrotoga sp. HWHPT.55.6.3]PNR92612.1 flagellar hook-basal body protein [Petrotoga sp. HWHPT.55.6.3]
MLGSIYSGITGLRNFQDQLDIVANNIANVNTVGYKGSRATFQTLLFQNLRSGMAPQNQLGGINPMQIGAGSQLASIDKIMTQGSPMSTGKVTDLMIQGEGFFILSDGTDQYYTRAGNFTRDYNGFFLEPATGMKLQGWTAQVDEEGNRFIDTNEPIGDIQVSANQIMEATETSFVALANNLNAGVGIQDTTIVVKSTTGESIPIKFSFTRDMSSEENKDKNVYNWTASVVGSDYKFALYDSSTGYLTSTNEITGKVELDNTGNVINWVNYDGRGVPIDNSKISINEIVDKNGAPVSLEAAAPVSAELLGSISVKDSSGNAVYYDPTSTKVSFIDTDNDGDANQVKITLTMEGGTTLTFTAEDADGFTIGEFNTLLATGIEHKDVNGVVDYTLTGLKLTGGADTDILTIQTISDLKSQIDPKSVITSALVPATLEGSISMTNGSGDPVYFPPQNIKVSFNGTDVTITLKDSDGDVLTLTKNETDFGDGNGEITIKEFNDLMLETGSGVTNGTYTLKGLKLTGGADTDTIDVQVLDGVQSVSIPEPASAEVATPVSATLTGSITLTDETTGETVYYDPENIDIEIKGTVFSITLTKKDGTILTFTKDATSFGNNDAEISIEEFNDLLSEGIVDESGTYTLTGLHLVGDSDTYTINNQSLSDLKSVREMIQTPLGGAIRLTDLNNPTNFSEAEYVNPSVTTSTVVYDSLGNPYNVYLRFSKIDANTWYWKAELEDGHPLFKSTTDGQLLDDPAEGVIAFDANGNIAATQWKINPDGTIDQDLKDGDNGAAGFWFDPAKVGAALNDEVDPESAAAAGPVNVSINFQELTQFFAENSIAVTEQDGNAQGTLESFAIDNNGLIIGSFTNGLAAPLGQIALATFNNPEGLSATGNSMYAMSPNSGTPQIGISGVGGKGSINSGALEMSNVDLAEEFTNMIIAQRGFQANSRSITTADAILNEIINIKR